MSQSASFPAAPGTYLLLFRLSGPVSIQPGRLGAVALSPGVYAYVGSAQGPGGLAARLRRHLRSGKRPHWHIDALTGAVPVQEVWMIALAERLECRWSVALRALPGVEEPVPGFGASDCRCRTHLYHLPDGSLEAARAALGHPERISTGEGV